MIEHSQQQVWFEGILHAITDAVVIVDPQRRIIKANPAFTRMSGYTSAEVMGKTPEFLYAFPEDFAEQGEIRFHAKAAIEQPIFEIAYRHKDGTVVQCETLGTHIQNKDGELLGFLAVIRDISERKKKEEKKYRLENQLRQAYKMDAIGTLAGGIAHEFSNILGIIFGNADMALDDIPDENPARENIHDVIEASDRARGLVRQLLNFTRQSEQEFIQLAPDVLIKESLKFLRSTTLSTICIIENISKDCGLILSDPAQFQHLFMNLCLNAVQAMNEGGTLEVIGKVVPQDAVVIVPDSDVLSGPFFKLSVCDTGVGMDAKTQECIFDPFFTTEEPDSRTGMGLSIVMGIVRNHGGMITVDSQPGKGSSFHIYFPQVKQENIQDRGETDSLPQGTEQVLLVDDEKMLLKMGKKMLERQGYQVTAESNSLAALEIFQARPGVFDLVITDQAMPNMTGLELAVELLKMRADIPVILCTGYSDKFSEEKALKSGIREFCYKPFERINLLQKIRKILDES